MAGLFRLQTLFFFGSLVGVGACATLPSETGEETETASAAMGLDEDCDDEVRCGPVRRVLARNVRRLLAANHVEALPPPPDVPPAMVDLGRDLFFDKILSGGFDVSCSTCHNPTLGIGDDLAVFAGVNGSGLGHARRASGAVVGARHSQNVFNLHLLDKGLAIDGKVEMVGDQVMTLGLPLIPQAMQDQLMFGKIIAAQAMLPQATPTEMLGLPNSNPLASCPPFDLACAWNGYMDRLKANPEYVAMFQAAYPGTAVADLNFSHVGNAIAAWQLAALAFDDSPFDRFLRGDDCALTVRQLQGAEIFYDSRKGNCASCHSGGALTDKKYHKTLTPQFGPGNTIPAGDGPGGLDDFGRMRLTGDPNDKYAWRTPPLRNIAIAGPYGRLGQFATLESQIKHYRDPVKALVRYDITKEVPDPALWGTQLDNVGEVIANGYDPLLDTVKIRDARDVRLLVAFLGALTDERARQIPVPERVPSGLPVH